MTGLLPNEILTIVSHVLVGFEAECETYSDSYKVNVKIVTESDVLVFKVDIFECENELYLVKFKINQGCYFDFVPILSSLMELININSTDT